MPACFATMLVCYVDRTNISIAAIDMETDIGVSKKQFGVASSLFFATYMVFQIPSNAVQDSVGGPIWLGVLLIGWGAAASLTAFVQNVTHLYTLRLVLGAFEAGTIPGVMLYVGKFFPPSRAPAMYGLCFAGSAAGSMISAPLGAGLLAMDGLLNFRGWRWMFLLEGLPSIILGIVMMFFLPKSPAAPGFLTAKELEIVKREEVPSKLPEPWNTSQLLYFVKTVVLNVPLMIIAFCSLLAVVMRYTAIFWTPLWIDAMASGSGLDWEQGKKSGSSSNSVQVALLSAVPYAVAAVSAVFFGWTSEKLQDRTIHCASFWFGGGLIFVLLPWLAQVNVFLGFFALLCGHIGVNAYLGAYFSLQTSFMEENNESFGLAWMNMVANLGGLFGPMLMGFLAKQTGSYKVGMWVTGAMSSVAGIVVLFVKDSQREERRKARLQSVPAQVLVKE